MVILIIHIIVSYDQNISLIFLCERWIPCQASTSVLCLHYRPETVHCSTKDAYTSEITFLVLHPWFCQYFQFWTILEYVHHNAAKEIESLPQTQISKLTFDMSNLDYAIKKSFQWTEWKKVQIYRKGSFQKLIIWKIVLLN